VDTAQAGAHTATRSAEALALLENDWPRTPNPWRARFVVAMALVGCGRWTEAAVHLEALVAARPDAAQARNALGNCYNRLGRAADAIREYREAYRSAPDFHPALTAVLGTLNAAPEATPEEVFAAHREWAAAVAAPFYPTAPRFGNPREPNRRLRIGYVSPDLRRHPVGTMLAPVLERHDPRRVEIFCYYSYRGADVMTERMRRAAQRWRDVAELDDARRRRDPRRWHRHPGRRGPRAHACSWSRAGPRRSR
jgi:predicted O-linked N-acetylglucosamine transferase (SPINDLY family)